MFLGLNHKRFFHFDLGLFGLQVLLVSIVGLIGLIVGLTISWPVDAWLQSRHDTAFLCVLHDAGVLALVSFVFVDLFRYFRHVLLELEVGVEVLRQSNELLLFARLV